MDIDYVPLRLQYHFILSIQNLNRLWNCQHTCCLNKTPKNNGFKVKEKIIDNEASKAYQTAIQEWGVKFQLNLLDVHQRNTAERAIIIFKEHFMAIFAGIDPQFPLSLWDKLLHQAQIIVNLLKNPQSTPKFPHGDFSAQNLITTRLQLGCSDVES